MLQPRRIFLLIVLLFLPSEGLDVVSSPRQRRQNANDVTTVLLVDNHGRSSFGRFLSVKPDLGLITSTARTFIQEGVTTEYATQVLGTTLDNGHYAHLLTKSSRVLYDGDAKTHEPHKKWNLDLLPSKNYARNTDFISPNQVQPVLVFPTTLQKLEPQALSAEEILEEEPSNNPRVPFENPQQNVKVFKINPQMRDLSRDQNIINHKEDAKPINLSKISKVRPWDNLPTFTVRNEFSPSGFSYLGDFPEFDTNTEKTKSTTSSDRRAKLLFRAGFAKPETKDLKTTTYSGFADFTTTVGDTVIVFTPHTTEPPKNVGKVTKISVPPTIQPTTTFSPTVSTAIKTFLMHDPPMETHTVEGHKLEMKTSLPTMVIDKTDRTRRPKGKLDEATQDMEAKSAVLAHEQQTEKSIYTQPRQQTLAASSGSTIIFGPELIQPSESQPTMLSTPSDEDIAKIFASLQAQAKMKTQPLNTPATIFLEESSKVSKPEVSTGAKTIFFDDDLPIENTAVVEEPVTTKSVEEKITTTEEQPQHITTERLLTTTQEEPATTNRLETTSPEVLSTIPQEEETPDFTSNEVDKDECSEGAQIVPTTVYKTLTYLTTFYIPQDNDETSTSVKSNEVISTEIGFETRNCQPSITVQPTIITTTEQEETITQREETTTHREAPTTTEATEALETTPQEITTERRHVTESEPETTEGTTESGEEIEVIFKTLYTTYTYLTTYFQDTTSSIASKIVVTTNVITSTLVPGSEASDSAVAALLEPDRSRTVSFDDLAEISPTKLDQNILPTVVYENDNLQSTPLLNDAKIQANGVKTYYTTYTYFTTIFVDGETEISSRTEVYTNYVTPSIQPTNSIDITPTRVPFLEIDDSKIDELLDEKNQVEVPEVSDGKKTLSLNVTPRNTYNSTINRHKTETDDIYSSTSGKLDNNILSTNTKEQSYITLNRGAAPSENNLLTDYETIATMVTDVRSSTSEGGRRILENVDRRNALDDQVVSESNNDSEIIPSPTLLLQTSYTTFTYFTTMYQGTTSSNVVSRLETITNVVTETLTPTHTLSVEDQSLPITYFTTFTYWTTLYKNGVTKTTSREETVSNVVTPTPSLSSTSSVAIPTSTSTVVPSSSQSIQPSIVGDDDLTTYFTTYTYYTTSYVGDSSVINSRLETVTQAVNSTADLDSNQIGRAVGTVQSNQLDTKVKESSTIKPTGLLSTILNTVENSGTTTILSTDVFGTYIDGLYAKVLESTSSVVTDSISPSSVETNVKPTGVVSINQGKIIDADGISTLYYTTQAIGTYIDNLYAQVIESTSSLQVNEERKSALATDALPAHRTGLVRLIEGSIIQNATTTLYESKVLGTVIDGRYAQIIESTSSFLVDKITPSSVAPTPSQQPEAISSTTVPIAPSPVVIESSLSDASKIDEEGTTENPEDDEDDDGSSRTKSRLTFQSRKRTFTPVIRPFASRGRPTFAPKRKGVGQGATTVTRSDVTPTVTAVPASKARFGNRKSSSSSNTNIAPTASGSRRFARPKSSSVALSARRSSRIQPTASNFGGSSRRAGLRSSSSIRASSSRFRIKPTSTLRNFATNAIESDNDLTTVITDDPTDVTFDGNETTLPLSTTTEGASRRRENPLLRFRRPPIARQQSTPRPPKAKPKSKTTTTPRPRTTRPSSVNRPRNNALFPRRNLFTTTTQAPPEEEEEEDLEEEGENEEEDTDYESSQTSSRRELAPRQGRSSQIKPFVGFRKRTRREVNYSRFRRPSTRTTAAPVKEPETEAPKSLRTKPSSRFSPRNSIGRKTTQGTTSAPTTTRKRITPSKASTQARSQFTLREKDTSRNNFKRPTTSNSRSRQTTVATRPKSPRLRTTAPPENRRSSSRTTQSRRRTTSRQRTSQEQIDDNFVIPAFDGTITVTYSIPTEVTIPVVNGKVTEYKNVITAKYSTDVLAPKQYSTSINAFGKDVTVLLGESTTVGDNGATLITQYVLNETPTTSVLFTPTYIRGRKTSFSHVIPSTAYGVEEVVNTIQPALAAQAPLANILLSQLLLGQNPLYNPLQNPVVQATPTTEFKTRATTYVTTVTSVTSTVIPLTFRGKEILTTIIDSSTSVVTATEFLTDTVIVTPTAGFAPAAPQLNTLLLPLLQQQLAQQAQPAGVFNLNNSPQAQPLLRLPQKSYLTSEEDTEEVEQGISSELTDAPPRKRSRKKNKKVAPAPTEPPKETSVITLYVSGRIPGEFSTVLSTVVSGENERRKREVQPSQTYEDIANSQVLDSYLTPALKEVFDLREAVATESLESIIGDVSKHIITETTASKPTSPSKKTKINVTDLAEIAPLMPKVETSLWGNTTQNSNHVSKYFGNRRVVKKLVRKEPIEVNSRRPRRKLVIKKKKRKLKPKLKTVVITRKRILPKTEALVATEAYMLEAVDSTTPFTADAPVATKVYMPEVLNSTASTLAANAAVATKAHVAEALDSTTTPFAAEFTNEIEVTEENLLEITEETQMTDAVTEENLTEENLINNDLSLQIPPYEPFFPELSENPDAAILLLKTTVVSSIELNTKTIIQSRLRTYTFVVTRVNGDEHIVTSTTEVRPQTKTTILTEPLTKVTTLTLLDSTFTPYPEIPQLKHTNRVEQAKATEEARYNLATRIMSNGVEVIVAGDKTTIPGDPNYKRIVPSTFYKPVTLKPSTLSEHMMMILPSESSNIDSLVSLYPNQFVTKTCLTTFTYLTTYLESGTTTVSSHEQVVSNIATEERNTGKILPTPSMGITLTQYPNLSVGLFHTTYTYLNTILDGEQPLVVSSKHTVTNTVTAPDDYLSLLHTTDFVAVRDTNTYYSTVSLSKTLYESGKSQVFSTNEVVTQVVITESVPPKPTSVMTSYIAVDMEPATISGDYTTTDVTKTYFVTYTYYKTHHEHGKKVTKTNISVSSEVVTEKLYQTKKKDTFTDLQIYATKTYFTTFTYFTTLLEHKKKLISSHSKVVENVVTETLSPNMLDPKYLHLVKKRLRNGEDSIANIATLNNGETLEVTIIKPTPVLPQIQKTQIPKPQNDVNIEGSTPSVVIGSTIIFFDDETPTKTPSLSSKVVKKTEISVATSKIRRSKTKSPEAKPTKKVVGPNVPDMLGLGSININNLQALTPVLNAMAGLIENNLKTIKKNETVSLRNATSGSTNHAPIYIPVGGVTEDFETAESQNLANFAWDNPQKTHENALLLNRGIPISPGDVINTNSDVIVGKPGRVAPRIPSIPLTDTGLELELPLPISNKWPKRHHEKFMMENDYVGPPPPLVEKHHKQKHIPVHDTTFETRVSSVAEPKANVLLHNPIKQFPSVILPEVIERSTGQPLLVNIQPSQVAFINIPHNRTTALIYGGSTERHHNGQYFDEPSPYSMPPEFVATESFHFGKPQFASIYNGQHSQKEVGGVIKVAPQAIERPYIQPTQPTDRIVSLNVPPISFGVVQQDNEFNAYVINHDEMNTGEIPVYNEVENIAKPIPTYNFGALPPKRPNMVKEQIKQPLPPKKLYPEEDPLKFNRNKVRNILENNFRKNFAAPNRPRPDEGPKLKERIAPSQKEVPVPNKRPIKTRPNKFEFDLVPPKPQEPVALTSNKGVERPLNTKFVTLPPPTISSLEYMTPPPFISINKLQHFNWQQPKPIPLTPEEPEENYSNDDINEDGEVVQESNNRPLRPGQLPFEFHTSTTLSSQDKRNSYKDITIHEQPKPVVSVPRPFGGGVKFPTSKPNSTFITYIGSVTGRPIVFQTTTEKVRLQVTTPRVTTFHGNSTWYGPFGSKSRTPVIPTSPKMFSRPRITSLPLDQPTVKPVVLKPPKSQKPFSIAELLNREKVVTDKPEVVPAPLPTDMEIMKPPPLEPEVFMKPPAVPSPRKTTPAPSKLEPAIYMKPPTPKKRITSPSPPSIITVENLIPPPTPEIIGMSPPALKTTTKPSTTPAAPITTRRPNYNIYMQSRMPTTPAWKITKRPTAESVKPVDLEVLSSEVKAQESDIKAVKTPFLEHVSPTSYETSTMSDIIATGVHHGGNEIKIVDDSTSTSVKFTASSSKESKIIPTRYITHTKTSTVTITKTTVVKTLGGPPSTLTLLVTKTEKATIVDTVTEFHTLVQPTSITETITTTTTISPIEEPDNNMINPSSTIPFQTSTPPILQTIIPTITVEDTDDDSLEDFIIKEDNPVPPAEEPEDNESIFVVMTDKNKASIVKIPNNSEEIPERDEIINNKVNNILLGGIFIATPPSFDIPPSDRCEPECKASRNELCQKAEGVMRCVCRPGFARMFPDRPCIPTYTYELHADLERIGREKLRFNQELANENSTEFRKLTRQIHDAVDRMVMQSDLRDVYHGVHISSYNPSGPFGVTTKFFLQLSDNTDEKRLEDIFKKYLRSNNYSLGGTEIFASKEGLDSLRTHDFDECLHAKFHDCSENAQCFNLKGTYTCSCKEGFSDLSENILYPGRLCSAELLGCERCNYHGTCYSRGDDQNLCECFHWYTGESCHINLKVLLIALVTLGLILFVLLLICIILTCCRKKSSTSTRMEATGMSFLPQRVALDRRAMIQDTSSEDSRSETNLPMYVPKKKKVALKPPMSEGESYPEDQKDRSLPVMIPRAKYHPGATTSPLHPYTSFDAQKPSPPIVTNETKLLSYLDAGPSPSKSNTKRKYSDSYTESKFESRKNSGALVSAGFEVSATVLGNNMGTLCGTEADRSENATLIQKISAELLSNTGTRSHFNTLRGGEMDNMGIWLDINRVNTISDARSYDETTIPPPMKSFRGDYDSKPSSQHHNDEANTMAERDLGSTFLLPHTHLYKPDRGSDISGFESL